MKLRGCPSYLLNMQYAKKALNFALVLNGAFGYVSCFRIAIFKFVLLNTYKTLSEVSFTL